MTFKENNTHFVSRRYLLRLLAATSGSLVVTNALPNQWLKPSVEVGFLPVHAQSSPTATATPVSNFMVSIRELTPCENLGRHHLFIKVFDANSVGLPHIPVRVLWSPVVDGSVITYTDEHGEVSFAMFKGNYWIQVLVGNSETAGPLTPDFAQNEACGDDNNAISLYHTSFDVIFTRSW